MEQVYQVRGALMGKFFAAGVAVADGLIIGTAPILAPWRGRRFSDLQKHEKWGWTIEKAEDNASIESVSGPA